MLDETVLGGGPDTRHDHRTCCWRCSGYRRNSGRPGTSPSCPSWRSNIVRYVSGSLPQRVVHRVQVTQVALGVVQLCCQGFHLATVAMLVSPLSGLARRRSSNRRCRPSTRACVVVRSSTPTSSCSPRWRPASASVLRARPSGQISGIGAAPVAILIVMASSMSTVAASARIASSCGCNCHLA